MRISPTQPKYLGIQVTGKIEDGKVVLFGDKTGVFNTLPLQECMSQTDQPMAGIFGISNCLTVINGCWQHIGGTK
ncbi:MAG TPA: hypothetical protein DIT62_07215 [Alphaproteobacteria bacterium]|nr:hypothetical protein [Alphaproteobacteria bacterium]